MEDTLPVLAEPTAIEQMADPAHYVELACERAKAWLSDALAHGDIDDIVEIKSQAEAIRIYTTQKKLGRDAELAAAEVVRRAERGIGVAIRRGQEEGEIAGVGSNVRHQGLFKTVIGDPGAEGALFQSTTERSDAYAMTDDVTDEQFDEAIEEAKAEGNLSRANVVRKVKGTPPPEPRGEYHAKRRHIDHYRVLGETVAALEGLASGLRLLDIDSIPEGERADWGAQLREALRPLTKFAREVTP